MEHGVLAQEKLDGLTVVVAICQLLAQFGLALVEEFVKSLVLQRSTPIATQAFCS
jgi:hypothetical protein